MTNEAEGLAEKLVYIGAMLVAHCDKFPVPSHVLAHAATATQAAAALRDQAERVRVLEGRNAEVNMLAHGWMARHDWLLSFIQDQPSALRAMLRAEKPPYPSPADLPDALQAAEARAEALERREGELEREVAKLRRILSTPTTEA